jgi:phospholipid/cholesterol/gamma-HCH transport system substrate-binding protein
MGTKSARESRLGAVMILAFLALAGGVAYLIWNKLYEPKERYHIRFTDSVSGLEVGTGARMLGVHVGQVETITIDQHGTGVLVTLALHPGTPITEDTRATMTPIGITGLQFIELSGGTRRSKLIEPDTPRSVIKAGATVLRSLMKQGNKIVAKAGLLNDQLVGAAEKIKLKRIRRLQDNALLLASTVEDLRADNSKRVARISRNVDRVTAAMERASKALKRLERDTGERLPEARKAAMAAIDALEQAVNALEFGPTERAVERAVGAAKRRGAALNLDGVARTLEVTSKRLNKVSNELGSSLTKTDAQWIQIKKKLKKAGRFIRELKRRYIKEK